MIGRALVAGRAEVWHPRSAQTHFRQTPTSGGHQTSVGRPLTMMASSPSSALRSSVIAGCLAAGYTSY